MRVGSHRAKYLDPINLRQFQVEQNNFRMLMDVSPRVLASTEQPVQRFLAVLDVHQVIGKIDFSERAQGYFGITRIVFDEQNFNAVGW
jgi:hypothetical protein